MSLHRGDWAKILGGLALAATGAGLAGAGPLAAMMGTAGGATGAGATGAGLSTVLGSGGTIGAGEALGGATALGGAGGGFSGLVGNSLLGAGTSAALAGTQGTPSETMKQVGPPPPMPQSQDPFDILKQIQSMKSGGLS